MALPLYRTPPPPPPKHAYQCAYCSLGRNYIEENCDGCGALLTVNNTNHYLPSPPEPPKARKISFWRVHDDYIDD